MRFLFVPLFLAVMATSLFSQNIYYVGAPGTAPGGSDPYFSTLKEACDYLNAFVWTSAARSDTIFITSDLTEPAGVILTANNRTKTFNTASIIFTGYGGEDRIITFTGNDTLPYTQVGWELSSFDITITGLTIQGDTSGSKNILPLLVSEIKGTGFDNSPMNVYNNRILYKSQTQSADSTVPCYAVKIGSGQVFLYNNLISADYPGVSPYTIGVLANFGRSLEIYDNNITAKRIGISWVAGSVRGSSLIQNNFITVNQDLIPVHIYGILQTQQADPTEILNNRINLSQNNFSRSSGATGILMQSRAAIYNNVISGFFLCDNTKYQTSRLIGIEASGAETTAIVGNVIILDDVLLEFSTVPYIGLVVPATSPQYTVSYLRHNSFVVHEDDFRTFCVDFMGDSLNSDSNDFNLTDSAFVGIYLGTNAKTLADWQALSGQDMNSGFIVTASRPTDVITDMLPEKFELQQNYPNPFNPATTIKYQMPIEGAVTLKIFDILGNEVKTLVNENKPAGSYQVELNASELASGTYIYRLMAGDKVYSKKMLLLK